LITSASEIRKEYNTNTENNFKEFVQKFSDPPQKYIQSVFGPESTKGIQTSIDVFSRTLSQPFQIGSGFGPLISPMKNIIDIFAPAVYQEFRRPTGMDRIYGLDIGNLSLWRDVWKPGAPSKTIGLGYAQGRISAPPVVSVVSRSSGSGTEIYKGMPAGEFVKKVQIGVNYHKVV